MTGKEKPSIKIPKNIKADKKNDDGTGVHQKTGIFDILMKKDYNPEVFTKFNHDAEEVIYFGSEKFL